MVEIGTQSVYEWGGGGASPYKKRGRGGKNCTPLFLDSLILNEPEKVKKSILAKKSYGITYHTALVRISLICGSHFIIYNSICGGKQCDKHTNKIIKYFHS